MELDLGEVLLGGRAARHRALDPTQPLRAERVCRRRRIGLQEEEGRVVRFYLTLILTLSLKPKPKPNPNPDPDPNSSACRKKRVVSYGDWRKEQRRVCCAPG